MRSIVLTASVPGIVRPTKGPEIRLRWSGFHTWALTVLGAGSTGNSEVGEGSGLTKLFCAVSQRSDWGVYADLEDGH